ncbi:RNA chaperone Hfq [Bacillus salitolerans]|uniref:RNA-binding protein Hfq n=1 Tax=Bacillus salitolerans TaxID=1437434 RepID=A0ABW4LLW3_9BACI
MARTTVNVQDVLLNEARKSKINVTIITKNGFQTPGQVIAFDNFVIILSVNGKQQMFYKHAVSTIIPSKKLEL